MIKVSLCCSGALFLTLQNIQLTSSHSFTAFSNILTPTATLLWLINWHKQYRCLGHWNDLFLHPSIFSTFNCPLHHFSFCSDFFLYVCLSCCLLMNLYRSCFCCCAPLFSLYQSWLHTPARLTNRVIVSSPIIHS